MPQIYATIYATKGGRNCLIIITTGCSIPAATTKIEQKTDDVEEDEKRPRTEDRGKVSVSGDAV